MQAYSYRRAKVLRKTGLSSFVVFWVVTGLLTACAESAGPAPTVVPTRVVPGAAATAPAAEPKAILSPSPAVKRPLSLTGTWVGGYTLRGDPSMQQMVTLTLSQDAGDLAGTIQVMDGDSHQLSAATLRANEIHFEAQSTGAPGGEQPLATIIFDGQVDGDTITGTTRAGSANGDLRFVRSNEQAGSLYTELAGTYIFASGRALGFYETPGASSNVFATRLLYADLQTGELGAAFPVTGTTFAVGPAVGLAYPFRGEVTFKRSASGEVTGLDWRPAGSSPRPETATKLQVNIEEVTYPSGDITLAGRLASPATPGKHPAVVIVHGAGKVTRRNWLVDLLDGYFAAHGIATLSYDKRGVGDSGGVYSSGVASEEMITTLGADALAGLKYLQSRPGIDPGRVGLQGSSQAGWIIPYAAAESKDLAFMMLWSGPGVTQGISDTYDKLAESSDREQLTRTLQETPPFGFDPVPYLEQTSAPGFWGYGGSDMTVPVPESIANLEKVKAAGHKDYTWNIYPGADHYLFVVKSSTGDDLRLSPGYPPLLFDQMTSWLKAHNIGN